MIYDILHSRIARAAKKKLDSNIVDALLNRCTAEHGECSICARIICPYECELHFHHDGCPACAERESR